MIKITCSHCWRELAEITEEYASTLAFPSDNKIDHPIWVPPCDCMGREEYLNKYRRNHFFCPVCGGYKDPDDFTCKCEE